MNEEPSPLVARVEYGLAWLRLVFWLAVMATVIGGCVFCVANLG